MKTGDRIEVMTKSEQVHSGRLVSLGDDAIVFRNSVGDAVYIRWENVEYYKEMAQQ